MPGASSSRNPASIRPVPGRPATAGTEAGWRLVVIGPVLSGQGRTHHLRATNLLVGRAADNDVVLDEASVSARHARIDLEAGVAFVTDLGSTNGTFLDGRRLTGSTELPAGSTLTLGRCALLVQLEVAAGFDDVEPGRSPAEGSPPLSPSEVDRAELLEQLSGDQPVKESREGVTIPARRPQRLLVSFDAADHEVGTRIGERLERIGHTVVVPRQDPTPATGQAEGDNWGGRLLEVMWATDAVIFVVSAAAATSEQVHREVHLAGAERTPVIPVLAGPVDLPDDLAYYLQRQVPVDLRRDMAAGLSQLQGRLDDVHPKRVARPWQLARRVLGASAVFLVVATLALLVLG